MMPEWPLEALGRVIEKSFPLPQFLWKESNPTAESDLVLRGLQRGVAELLLGIRPEYLLTIRFEQACSSEAIRSRLKRFGALLDGQLLGSDWHRSSDRSLWIAVVEDHRHVHILLRPPARRNLTHYTAAYGPQAHLRAFWTSIVRRHKIGARIHVARLHEGEDLAAACYCAKRAWRKEMWKSEREFLILGSEFHSRRVQQLA